MTDYRAVMDLVLQGWSVRQICSTVRCSHTTVQKARHTMATHKITTHAQLAGITDEEMATWFVDGRSGAQGDFVPIDFDAVTKARTGRSKVTLQVLWGRYTTHQLTQVSVTTATSDSASLLPNTSMPQVLAHALRTLQHTPCKPTGRAPKCVCLTRLMLVAQKSAFSWRRCRIPACCLPALVPTSDKTPGWVGAYASI